MKLHAPHHRLMLCGLAALTFGAPVVQAQEIGRLLLSPVERSTVERVRANINAGISAEGAPVIILPDEVAAVARAEPQTLNGWVLRAGQRSTVWVNGEPYYRFDNPGATRRSLQARGLLAEPGKSGGLPGLLALKPGQTRDPETSQPVDLLPPGAFKKGSSAQAGPAASKPASAERRKDPS
jgi:hypothetical protein